MYLYIDDENYAATINSLADSSSLTPGEIAYTMAAEGAIFPNAIKSRMDGDAPSNEAVRFIEDGSKAASKPGFLSDYEDLLPSISPALEEIVRDFGV